MSIHLICFFFQAEDGIRDVAVTGVQTCALPISRRSRAVAVFRPYSRGNSSLTRSSRSRLDSHPAPDKQYLRLLLLASRPACPDARGGPFCPIPHHQRRGRLVGWPEEIGRAHV